MSQAVKKMGQVGPYSEMIWKLCTDQSSPQLTYDLISGQLKLARLSFTGKRNVNAPEAYCEYGEKHIHFSQKSALSFKVGVTNTDTGEQVASLIPSQIQNKAVIELPIGNKYKVTKKGILHIKLEISDEIERKLCEFQSVSLESTDYKFNALDIRPRDPEPVLLSILSFYLYECIGYNSS
jgi:hypothetical protein